MKFDDLPPAMQAQVERKLGEQARKPRTTRKAAAGTFAPGHCSCGETFTTFGAYERHRRAAGEPGHARYELDL